VGQDVGAWIIQVEMLGFQPVTQEIKAGPEHSNAEWDLAMLPLNEIRTEAAPAVFQQTEISASQTNADASPAAQASPSSAFANLNTEQLSGRAADGLLINGSVHNGADSPFAQRAAFGNNRWRRSL
jgi:hypothetical protein